MPIDIALSTNRPTGALELRQAQPMPGGAGYAALLIVRSGGFAAAVPFLARTSGWRDFLASLDRMILEPGSSARLVACEGEDEITIADGSDGTIAVSGTLHEKDQDQMLRFRFLAPSAGLPALLAGVRELVERP